MQAVALLVDNPRTGDELRLFRLANRVTLLEVAAAMQPPVSRQRAWQMEVAARPSAFAAGRFAAAVRRIAESRP
jgi:hypothetical protein